MRLAKIESGQWVRVVGFIGGKGFEYKLRQLGLAPGDVAHVVRQAPFGGPLLVEVGGRAIALGKSVAARIEVETSECVLP
ncbi:MAG: ferrous iron transport protein A [Chloroflexi bacterium]|nr:ferrous iron transport protein A [Chloroflexota bacterium]